MQQPYIGAQGIQCPCETPSKCFGVHHALALAQAVVPIGSVPAICIMLQIS